MGQIVSSTNPDSPVPEGPVFRRPGWIWQSCSNPQDIIDGDEWDEKTVPSMVFIRLPLNPQEYWCYKRSYLLQSLHDSSRRMARWVHNPAATRAMTASGDFGYASPFEKDQFVLLFPNNLLLTVDSLPIIDRDDRRPSIYALQEVKEWSPARYGNVRSSFGSSELHGQHQGNVYRLIPIEDDRVEVVHYRAPPAVTSTRKRGGRTTAGRRQQLPPLSAERIAQAREESILALMQSLRDNMPGAANLSEAELYAYATSIFDERDQAARRNRILAQRVVLQRTARS